MCKNNYIDTCNSSLAPMPLVCFSQVPTFPPRLAGRMPCPALRMPAVSVSSGAAGSSSSSELSAYTGREDVGSAALTSLVTVGGETFLFE